MLDNFSFMMGNKLWSACAKAHFQCSKLAPLSPLPTPASKLASLMMFWPSHPQRWQPPLQSLNLDPQLLFLEEPQSKNLPACLFRKDRYNWATTTRFILKELPLLRPEPFLSRTFLPYRREPMTRKSIWFFFIVFRDMGPQTHCTTWSGMSKR